MITTRVKFTDNTRAQTAKTAQAIEMGMAHIAQDVEIQIKAGGRTPVKQGHLRGRTRHERMLPFKWRVLANVEYAVAQELGRAGNKIFRHYTTPGTGAGWFQEAVDKVTRSKNQYMIEAARAVKL